MTHSTEPACLCFKLKDNSIVLKQVKKSLESLLNQRENESLCAMQFTDFWRIELDGPWYTDSNPIGVGKTLEEAVTSLETTINAWIKHLTEGLK